MVFVANGGWNDYLWTMSRAGANEWVRGYRLSLSMCEVYSEVVLLFRKLRSISRRSLLPRTMTTRVIRTKDDPATMKFAVQK
jgi:hypothetical protein